MIDFNNVNWDSYNDAYGPAITIPDLLRQLEKDPKPKNDSYDETWFSLWSALYHQGDIYTASYAAVPYIIAIGHSTEGDIDQSFFHLPKEIILARVLMGKGPEIPPELYSAFFNSLTHLKKIKLAFKEPFALPDDGLKSFDTKDGLCKQCGHNGDPHLLISTIGEYKGGIILCPEEECTCFRTWSRDPIEEETHNLVK